MAPASYTSGFRAVPDRPACSMTYPTFTCIPSAALMTSHLLARFLIYGSEQFAGLPVGADAAWRSFKEKHALSAVTLRPVAAAKSPSRLPRSPVALAIRNSQLASAPCERLAHHQKHGCGNAR